MAERFISIPGGSVANYTCPVGKSAIISGMTVSVAIAGVVSVHINGSAAFSKTLTVDTHNLTFHLGKMSLSENQSVSVLNPNGKILITVLETDADYTGSDIVTQNYFVFNRATSTIVDYNSLLAPKNNVTIPTTIDGVTVTEIGSAFSGKGLTGNVPFLAGMTKIENAAYYGNNFGTSVVIPNTVKSIGQSAFNSAGISGTLTLSSTLESLGSYAFYVNSGLTGTVTIPDSVTFYDVDALSNTNISKIVIGSGCPNFDIGGRALCRYNNSLTEVDFSRYPTGRTIKDSNISAQSSMLFQGCPITTIKMNAGIIISGGGSYYAFGNNSNGFYTAYVTNNASAAGTYTYSGPGTWTKTA